MKKFFLPLSFLLVAGWTTTFAQSESVVNSRAGESFRKEFPGAQFVKWTETQNYQVVDFVLMDYRLEAFFSKQGELLETHRDLNYNQLPLAVMKELEKSFPNANYSEIEEVNNNVGTKYILRVETLKRNYKVVATPDGVVSITERIKK